MVWGIIGAVISAGVGLAGQSAAAGRARRQERQALEAGKLAARHILQVGRRNADRLMEARELAFEKARWQKQYTKTQVEYIRGTTSLLAGQFQDQADADTQLALDSLVDGGILAHQIFAEAEIEQNLIDREISIMEDIRKDNIAATFKMENKAVGGIVASAQASNVNAFSGSALDTMIAQMNEFDEQREAINYASATEQETQEIRKEQTKRQSIIDANQVLRRAQIQSSQYARSAYGHLSNKYATEYKGYLNMIDTQFRGDLAAYESWTQGQQYEQEAGDTLWHARLDAIRQEKAGAALAGQYSAQAAGYRMAALGTAVKGLGNIVSAYQEYQKSLPAAPQVQTPHVYWPTGQWAQPTSDWFGTGGAGAW